MSLRDLVTRVDAICKKYDKYDVVKHNEAQNVVGVDAFARLYGVVEAELDSLLQKSEAAATEKNRARAVAMNAEIRRTKARLLEELPKLQRLAFKKAFLPSLYLRICFFVYAVKGLSKEEVEARNHDLVSTIKERIEAIPDGTSNGVKPTEVWTASTSYTGIKIDSTSGKIVGLYKPKSL
ncbi:hypothetical protein L484_021464 [Morus notabilis]|uniref:Uncharacterized protein n=1 Tax=Morus notabilis TaxID=981085 RepID=W9SC61_9ROSA|nr:hypothetical protein L484_021464 [Morus notabilis]